MFFQPEEMIKLPEPQPNPNNHSVSYMMSIDKTKFGETRNFRQTQDNFQVRGSILNKQTNKAKTDKN